MAAYYTVRIPFYGYAEIQVEADSEDTALEHAFDVVNAVHIEDIRYTRDIMEHGKFQGTVTQAEVIFDEEVNDALD